MPWSRSASLRKPTSDGKPFISEKARQRPVRVLPPDDRAEFEAGHLIPRPDPLREDPDANFTQPTNRDEFSNENDGGSNTEDQDAGTFGNASFMGTASDHDASF